MRGQAGFTMIEMLVVLAILAMAMSLAPSIMAGLQGSRLRGASDQLIALLRETRNAALRRGEATEFVLDLPRLRFADAAGGALRPLPAGVDAVAVAPAALLRADGVVRIRFLADGTATAARITLRNGGSALAIGIDWLTGAVHRDD